MSQPIKLCVHELEIVFESQTSKNDLNERVMVRCPWASPRRQTWCWALLLTQRVSPHSRSPHLRAPARSTPDKAPGAHNKNLLDYWKAKQLRWFLFHWFFWKYWMKSIEKYWTNPLDSLPLIVCLIVGKTCFALLAKKVLCISTVAILNIRSFVQRTKLTYFCLGVLVNAA